ncbi:MAG: molybdopterin-dependent oxidoreductase, partial [Burkholderiaceae bacterium]
EEKRVVFHKDVGPLIGMEEMSRCIHCTRCIRFGQEVAGVMELGMIHRGEHAEITTIAGDTIDSELSGNMIDICPVGALTSKPFRYSARTWELSRRKSVSPHDSVGANLIVQVKNHKVMRVVPLENENVNECWIADRDRFSYEALNASERLTTPMLKQGGAWKAVDWPTALDYVSRGLTQIGVDHGARSVGALGSAHSTVEELHLLAKLIRGLGSDNIDFRTRHADFAAPEGAVRWLGTSIASLSKLQSVLVVGSFLRKDHPLFAQRLRQAVRKGARVHSIHATHDDWLMPLASRSSVAPSGWVQALADVATAVAATTGAAAPLEGEATDVATSIAKALLSGERKAILLGNAAAQHPQSSALLALAQWLGSQTGASVGFLTEAANTVGAQLVGAMPHSGGLTAGQMLGAVDGPPLKACLLLNVEPAFDAANAAAATAAMRVAEMVVVMSPFKNAASDLADVMLPIAPFTETSGSFVNAEGRVQSFHGVVRPLGDTRPAWKVLRVLGNMMGLTGFDFETSEEVRAEALGDVALIGARLNNRTDVPVSKALVAKATHSDALERVADVPIYAADSLVRRAVSLQLTADARAPMAGLPPALWQRLGLQTGDKVRVSQGDAQALLPARLDESLAANVVRVPAGHADTAALGAMFGAIAVEKA